MIVKLDPEEQTLWEMIVDYSGAEIHKEDWPIAERLVAKELITLGPARGPSNEWKRAELRIHES